MTDITELLKYAEGLKKVPNPSIRNMDDLVNAAYKAGEIIKILVMAVDSERGRHLHQYGVENETLESALHLAEAVFRGDI